MSYQECPHELLLSIIVSDKNICDHYYSIVEDLLYKQWPCSSECTFFNLYFRYWCTFVLSDGERYIIELWFVITDNGTWAVLVAVVGINEVQGMLIHL